MQPIAQGKRSDTLGFPVLEQSRPVRAKALQCALAFYLTAIFRNKVERLLSGMVVMTFKKSVLVEQNLADAVGIESYDVAQFAHAAMLNKFVGQSQTRDSGGVAVVGKPLHQDRKSVV